MNNSSEYTLILNYYNKSVELLEKHVAMCLNQSLEPKCIIGCFLGAADPALVAKWLELTQGKENIHTVYSDFNFKYIGRYQIALGAPTENIIMLDDDRFPSRKYCESIVSILNSQNCLVQNYGWQLKEVNGYISRSDHPDSTVFKKYADMSGSFLNPKTTERLKKESQLIKVDYLCGGICFRKSSLKYLFSEEFETETAEDIMFCFRAAKNGIPSLVFVPSDDVDGDQRMLGHDPDGVNVTVNDEKIWITRSRIIHRELGYPCEDFETLYKNIM